MFFQRDRLSAAFLTLYDIFTHLPLIETMSDNKRVAKNAVALTIRMIIVTVVGLYTSRIILEALGVEDFGIYGIVGGVVGMASFLNNAMAGATSRFITFELGREEEGPLKKVFSTALLIHFLIALTVVVLAETVGLWFLNNKLVIPENRMFAANVVYQFSVASIVIGFTQVPYNADIIAHEKMNVYAYYEIVNVSLKLGIVYLLFLANTDKLILYAGLTFALSVIGACFYRWYCCRNFIEARSYKTFDRGIAKELLAFSSYDLYGNLSFVVKNQGQPIILNLFFGVVANAAASIVEAVSGAISGLTSTITQAYRPQIIKLYASGEINQMTNAMCRSVQFTLFAYAVLAIPFLIETPRILYLWLGQIPPYSVAFLRIIIINSGFGIINTISNAAVHATGNIKRISFISGTLFMMCPVVAYVIFKWLHWPAISMYIVNLANIIIVISISFWIIRVQVRGFQILRYISCVIRCLVAIGLAFFSVLIIRQFVGPSFSMDSYDFLKSVSICVLTFLIGLTILVPLALIIAFDKFERLFLWNKCKSLIARYI